MLPAAAFEQHELVEFHQRIGEQRMTANGPEPSQNIRGGPDLRPGFGQQSGPVFCKFAQSGKEFGSMGILHPERRGDVLYRQTNRFDVEIAQLNNWIGPLGRSPQTQPADQHNQHDRDQPPGAQLTRHGGVTVVGDINHTLGSVCYGAALYVILTNSPGVSPSSCGTSIFTGRPHSGTCGSRSCRDGIDWIWGPILAIVVSAPLTGIVLT